MPKRYPPGAVGSQSKGVYLLSDAETHDARVVLPIRVTLVLLSIVFDLKGLDWRDFLLHCYQDLRVPLLNRKGGAAVVDLDWLDYQEKNASNDNTPPEGAEDPAIEKKVATFDDNLRSYLNETCRKVFDVDGTAVIRDVNRHKFIAIASIVAAAFPEISAYWPRHPVGRNDHPTADNDNHRPPMRRWR